jgi:hypothetical protein
VSTALDPPDAAQPQPPPRHRPPPGWKVALVLIAIFLALVLLCAACLLGYIFYVDARNNGR